MPINFGRALAYSRGITADGSHPANYGYGNRTNKEPNYKTNHENNYGINLWPNYETNLMK